MGELVVKANNDPQGRRIPFRPEFCDTVQRLALLGLSEDDMAKFFDISRPTFDRWKRDKVGFADAMRRGKTMADTQVAEALFRRATGYTHEAVKIFFDKTTDSEHIVPYIERFAPDTAAAMFWLKNRCPGQWNEKVAHELTGKDGGPIESSQTVNFYIPGNGREG